MSIIYSVSTDHELASKTALDIIKKGGNAIDAAIAAAFALSVVDPYNSGLGGYGVALVKRGDKMYYLNFIGQAPRHVKIEDFLMEKPWEEYRPTFDGPLSYLVPGNVAGWGVLHERFGQLEWKELVEPSIRLAEGHKVTLRISKFYERIKYRAGRFKNTFMTFYKNGEFPKAGTILRQPQLANTLRILAEEGWQSMYRGTVAEKIYKEIRKIGGIIDLYDLKSYSPLWEDPFKIVYNDYIVYSTGHATSGFTVLEWINILKQLRPFKSWTSGEFIHIFLEAGKLSLRDDDMWNSGKSSYKVPIEKLLSDSYAKELAAKIGERAQYYPPSSYLSYGNHTTSLSVLVGDEIITMTLTQMYGFERNGLLGDIGFSINDGMCYFSLNPKDKDFLSAGERPRHPFSPIIIENYNKNNIFSIGAAGGWTIPQTVVLTSIKILEFNEFIDYAVNSPRYVMRYRTNSIPYPPGTEVIIEEGIPYSTKMYLKSKGHKIAELTTLDESNKVGVVNGVQLINKKHFAGADKRRDGVGIAGII